MTSMRPRPLTISRGVLGIGFVIAGILHFVSSARYESIMPPWIPAHYELVLISGVAEIAGGVALLHGGRPRETRWWMVALLLAVFPANVHMALNPDGVKGLDDFPRWALWARLPLQAALIAWIVRATRTDD